MAIGCSMPLSQDEVEEITAVVNRVLDERAAAVADTASEGFWSWVKDNPAIPFAIVTFFIVLSIARLGYGVEFGTVMSEVARDYTQAQERHDLVAEHLELGNEFLKVQNLSAARAEFKAALNLEPTNPSGHRGLFLASLFEPVTDEYDAEVASKRLEFLLDKDVDNPILLMILGSVYAGSRDYTNAIRYYDYALEEDSELAFAYAGKGQVFSLQGKSDTAVSLYRQALSLSPGNTFFLNFLGYELYRMKEYRKALRQFKELLRFNPSYVLGHVDSARIDRILGDDLSAIDHEQKTMELLSTKQISKKERDDIQWMFLLGGSSSVNGSSRPASVTLTSVREKRYYSYLDLALTLHLRGGTRTVRSLLSQASKLQLSRAEVLKIRRVVLDDISLLEEERKPAAPRLAAFRALIER
jgi:tetratricopeptide (TPR) repeat protein